MSQNFGLGSLEPGNFKQNDFKSCSYSRKEKCPCRSIEQKENLANRMDTEQSYCYETFSDLGLSSDGFVCSSVEPSDRGVLFLDSSSMSISTGCVNNIVGEDVRLCISPICLIPRVLEYMRQSNSSHGSTMATETLVPRTTGAVDRVSSQTASDSDSVVSINDTN